MEQDKMNVEQVSTPVEPQSEDEEGPQTLYSLYSLPGDKINVVSSDPEYVGNTVTNSYSVNGKPFATVVSIRKKKSDSETLKPVQQEELLSDGQNDDKSNNNMESKPREKTKKIVSSYELESVRGTVQNMEMKAKYMNEIRKLSLDRSLRAKALLLIAMLSLIFGVLIPFMHLKDGCDVPEVCVVQWTSNIPHYWDPSIEAVSFERAERMANYSIIEKDLRDDEKKWFYWYGHKKDVIQDTCHKSDDHSTTSFASAASVSSSDDEMIENDSIKTAKNVLCIAYPTENASLSCAVPNNVCMGLPVSDNAKRYLPCWFGDGLHIGSKDVSVCPMVNLPCVNKWYEMTIKIWLLVFALAAIVSGCMEIHNHVTEHDLVTHLNW